MGNLQRELLTGISKRIIRHDPSDFDADVNAALDRLVNSETAKVVWLKLSTFQTLSESRFQNIFDVAEIIGWLSQEAFVPTPIPDIKTPAKAAKIADELIRLISNNEHYFGWFEDLTPEPKKSAQLRINLGILTQETYGTTKDTRYKLFTDATEEILARTLSTNKSTVSSEEALNLVLQRDDCFNSLLPQLQKFLAFASQQATRKPSLARPTKKLNKENDMAVEICSIFIDAYGTPHYEIVTSLCNAIYDSFFEEDTIKKWWQRRVKRDTSEDY